MSTPILLLPPSEGKAVGGRRLSSPDRFGSRLWNERAAVVEALAKVVASASEADLSKLLRVRGELLERAIAATQTLIDGEARHLPAWQRYSGVVWEHLDPETLGPSERARILVPSALYGITTAQDQVADYRLGMGTGLPGLGNLARFWRAPLAEVVRRARSRATVIDLLPAEHRRAIEWERVGTVVEVSFLAADGQRAVGHEAKAVKGRFARHLIDNGTAEALAFEHDGWKVHRSDRGFELRTTQ